MTLNLRTTICINMLILLAGAAGLISLVVFRVSEREIRLQQQHAAEQAFIAVETTVETLLRGAGLPEPGSDLRGYLNRVAAAMDCDMLVLTDRNNRELAIAGPEAARVQMHGNGTAPSRTIIHSLQRDASRTVIRHVCSGPVTAGTQVLGYLTIGFPAAQTNERISSAARMIVAYMLIDGVIVFFFGMFLLSRYVVRPVQRLSLDMQALAGGVLPRVETPPSDNEIDMLAATIKALYTELGQEQRNTAAQLAEITAKNRQLEQARHEILQSEKMASVGRLAAGIAHEIGNPAGILTGYIHMLKEDGISNEQRGDFLARMEREAERITTTIRELLSFAQPSSGTAGPLQLNDIISDCCTLFSYQRDAHGCTLIFEPAEGLPEMYGNARMLQQLVVNLLLNARDAMPAGGTVTVTTRQTPGSPALELTVADTGCGIDPRHLELIFDPFFTTKDPGRGTGLGLSNVHRIVELHGGSISVASETGRGTSFTITFPIRTEQPRP